MHISAPCSVSSEAGRRNVLETQRCEAYLSSDCGPPTSAPYTMNLFGLSVL